MKLFVSALSLCSLGAFVATGCGGDDDCPIGMEGCRCSAEGTCLEGLDCASNLCVDVSGSSGGGGGGTTAGVDLQACLECGESACPDEATACADGCGSVVSCVLECGTDANCVAGCSTDGLTVDDLTALQDYSACVAVECASECSASVSSTGGAPGAGGGATGGAGTSGDGGGSGAGGGTASGGNLIQNGDFSQGGEFWELTLNDGDIAASDDTAGEYCVSNLSSTAFLSFSLGYPPTASDAFSLEAGATYTLSYRVQGFASVTAKVGLAVDPYTSIAEFDDTVASVTFQTLTYDFSPTTAQSQVGLVFNATLDYGQSVCFDDVSLTRN